jgi:hypothetical protein
VRAIAPAAAAELERFLRMPDPLVVALGTGRALRGMVDAMVEIDAPQHRLVSLIGNIAPDGSASFFDVVMRIADKVRAPHYPMPVPVISPTPEENAAFHALAPVQKVVELARGGDVVFVGVGQMSLDAPLLADGFVTRRNWTRCRPPAPRAKWRAGSSIRRGAIWILAPTAGPAGCGSRRRFPALDRHCCGCIQGSGDPRRAEIPHHQRLGDRRAHRFGPAGPRPEPCSCGGRGGLTTLAQCVSIYPTGDDLLIR